MSVLIEGLTLVIPRKVLEAKYRGGFDGYLRDSANEGLNSRYSVADDTLAALSYTDTEFAAWLAMQLEKTGIVCADGAMAVEMVFVQEGVGPLLPCPWLAWEVTPEGVTRAWAVGYPKGEMAAPAGWRPSAEKSAPRSDIRDEPGRAMPLGTRNGLESWVDFNTGEVMFGLPKRKTPDPAPQSEAPSAPEPPAAPPLPEPEPGAMSAILVAAVESRGWRYLPAKNGTAVDLYVGGDNATFRLWGAVDEKLEQLSIFVISPSKVPVERRAAVAEFVARVNWIRRLGGYDFDFESGELVYKVGVDVEGGELTEAMVQNYFSQALWVADHYHNALQKVVFGGVEPKAAFDGIGKTA